MQEPTLEQKPFSHCSNQELLDNVLVPGCEPKAFNDCTPQEYQIEIAQIYAAILVAERSA